MNKEIYYIRVFSKISGEGDHSDFYKVGYLVYDNSGINEIDGADNILLEVMSDKSFEEAIKENIINIFPYIKDSEIRLFIHHAEE